jgi:hypothetical protein
LSLVEAGVAPAHHARVAANGAAVLGAECDPPLTRRWPRQYQIWSRSAISAGSSPTASASSPTASASSSSAHAARTARAEAGAAGAHPSAPTIPSATTRRIRAADAGHEHHERAARRVATSPSHMLHRAQSTPTSASSCVKTLAAETARMLSEGAEQSGYLLRPLAGGSPWLDAVKVLSIGRGAHGRAARGSATRPKDNKTNPRPTVFLVSFTYNVNSRCRTRAVTCGPRRLGVKRSPLGARRQNPARAGHPYAVAVTRRAARPGKGRCDERAKAASRDRRRHRAR